MRPLIALALFPLLLVSMLQADGPEMIYLSDHPEWIAHVSQQAGKVGYDTAVVTSGQAPETLRIGEKLNKWGRATLCGHHWNTSGPQQQKVACPLLYPACRHRQAGQQRPDRNQYHVGHGLSRIRDRPNSPPGIVPEARARPATGRPYVPNVAWMRRGFRWQSYRTTSPPG